ncbi:hypothetical protein DMC30DRAFT_200009 [Rhodotorula diobovata]|uniref:Uncharacterized protein n=1 Tax=Rhodotorula diobovata TaxID=5288 RepID=A0A5C5FXL9_9BASI|nr:hypothetical protein DMC30DRAFT_419881 [Rhodotorula diobovata]TNY17616.1 hypothetical protein DMC30DRAFT_429480 [Rhodotorula diobovata]TNY17630.1 hypothetical protein DMC30DRAFT_419603 [Rhodotorula diobovata]TNY21528.1 hypothetical protein DMC30DRAFT_200009 [Rhodotorula diobovata]
MLRRSSSSSSRTPSFSSFEFDRRSSSSWSSDGAFDLLEPVESSLPHDIVTLSALKPQATVKSASRRHHGHHHSSSTAACSLLAEPAAFSPFSFPRNHTTHARCPKHGIVHDPALALPQRDSRSLSSTSSSRSMKGSVASSAASSCSSGSSTCSRRSLKCTLKRAMSFKRP